MHSTLKNYLRIWIKRFKHDIFSLGDVSHRTYSLGDLVVQLKFMDTNAIDVFEEKKQILVGIPLQSIKALAVDVKNVEKAKEITLEISEVMSKYSKTHIILASIDIAKAKIIFPLHSNPKAVPIDLRDPLSVLSNPQPAVNFPMKSCVDVFYNGRGMT